MVKQHFPIDREADGGIIAVENVNGLSARLTQHNMSEVAYVAARDPCNYFNPGRDGRGSGWGLRVHSRVGISGKVS